MSSYPVGYEADFAVERSRLTTFFRLILYIPVAVVAYFYGLVGFFTWIGAFFAVLFTGRYPEGLYAFNGNLVRFVARSSAYQRLITDDFPPLGLDEHPEYPVRVPIAPAQEHYSRLKVLFRFLLGIPVMVIAYAMYILLNLVSLFSWLCIVFTGKQAEGLQDALNLGVAYITRAAAYFLYLTETYPPFSLEQNAGGVARASGTDPEPAAS